LVDVSTTCALHLHHPLVPSLTILCPKIVLQDAHLPMLIEAADEVHTVIDVVWISETEKNEILQYDLLSRTTFLDLII
jgi:hypothetical protein